MAKVWNPTEEHIKTRVFGNWFEFAPGKMKNMSQPMAEFIAETRQHTGLVVLPPQFDAMDEEKYIEGFEKTAEGKAIMAELRTKGIAKLIEFHLNVIRNNQVSLKRDLARHDPSNDPKRLAAIEMSPGEQESLRLVAKYRKQKLDHEENKVKEVEKLLEEVGPAGTGG